MSDIFKDMQANVGCDYISNLPSYKRKVWHEMKRLPLTNYDIKQLEDFSKYVFVQGAAEVIAYGTAVKFC